MAKDEDKEPKDGENAEEEAPKKSKKGIFLGGGVVGLIALAWVLSLVALPKETTPPPFQGPFLIGLSEEGKDVQVNLADGDNGRYLVMKLQGEYEAYDELYAQARVTDPLYLAKLRDVLIGIGRRKSSADLADTTGVEVFKGEIRDAVGPVVFPLHVGNPMKATDSHEESGLAPGLSSRHATMRGGFKSHVLKVDATAKTIQLDGGPVTEFLGNETDLKVVSEFNLHVYVDVTGLRPDFVGEVNVGTFGSLRSVLFDKFLVQ